MLRSLLRDKLNTSINVAGLSLALASCLVLGLYLRSELSYDRHHVNHERIYRVATEFTANGRSERLALASGLLAPMLAEDYADLQSFVRFVPPGGWQGATDRTIRHGNDAFLWTDVYVTDPTVFDVFTHEVVYGDPRTALDDPSSAAVSRTFARKYFGDTNPLGEPITLENGEQRTITLVFEDLPPNTHLKYDVLFSYNGVAETRDPVERARELFGANHFTYLLLPEGYDARRFETIAREFYDRHMAARGRELHAEGWSAWLQPLADIHLHSDLAWDRPTGNRYYVYGLEAAVAFLLLIACINHVNLATAAAARRAREIGTRKILGATRRALVLRFLGESLCVSAAALVVALALVEIVVPRTPIADWLGTSASLTPTSDPAALAAAIGFSLLVGLLAGLYPALYLSAVPARKVMTTGAKLGGSGLRLRELLVLLQFTVTAAVIACTLLMAAQMRHVASRPLGFDEQGRLVVTLRGGDLIERIPIIESELLANERILGVTSSTLLPGLGELASFMDMEANDGSMTGVLVNHLPVQENFIDVLGMEIVRGRNFSADVATDLRLGMIVNETLVRHMGWTEPIGKRMGLRGRTVVGVVRDFNFKSLHAPIEPLVMYPIGTSLAGISAEERPFQTRYLVVNVAARELGASLRFVERTLRGQGLTQPFEYRFLDEALGRLYSTEQHQTRLIGVFAGICIVVACLGLFGLAAFTTAQRTKEIGIRKVLGASTASIVALLAERTAVLVVLGSAAAAVIAYLAMERWLGAFAYRIEMRALPFVTAAAITLAVALATVALQALGAASARPVRSLRHD